MVDKCACMSVVAFGEIKKLQRDHIVPKTESIPAFHKPDRLELEVAENQYRNTVKYVSRAEEECKVDMEKVRSNLVRAMTAFKEGKPFEALDRVIDADVELRLAICPKE